MENNFNVQIKTARKACGMTQEQLAAKVGVSTQAVSKWEISSYPDASLLPAIANALGVTIDTLFGIGKKEVSLPQQVLEATRAAIPYDTEDDPYSGCLELMKEIFRAFAMGTCGCDEYRPLEQAVRDAETWETFSQGDFDCGFFQSRLPDNLYYFLLMSEPKNGYDKVLAYDDQMVELFRFLAMPDALRVMYFLHSRPSTMFFNERTLTQELGINGAHSKEIIDEMLRRKFIWQANYNKGASEEKIYQCITQHNFVQFITFTHTLLHQPCSYNYQTGQRTKPYFTNDTYKKQAK